MTNLQVHTTIGQYPIYHNDATLHNTDVIDQYSNISIAIIGNLQLTYSLSIIIILPVVAQQQFIHMLNELHCMQQTILEYSETLLQLNTVCSYSNITIRYYIGYIVPQQKRLSISASAQGKRSLSTRTAWHSLVPLFSKENNGCYSQHACAYQGRCISHM